MPTSIVTTEDLREFKMELIEETKEVLINRGGTASKKVAEIVGSHGSIEDKPGNAADFTDQWNYSLHQDWRSDLL